MIKTNEPLSIAEITEYVKKDANSETDIVKFIKKFTKLKLKEAKELREKIDRLNLMKINDKHICKMIDFLPENQEELNKIVNDVALDEDETKKLLDTIKEFR